MGHTFSLNNVHVIFSTKGRRRTIPRELQHELWAYLAGIGKNHGVNVVSAGGAEDHVHVLLRLPPPLALAKAVLLLKANSSRWMSERARGFAWQEGYGAFSVSASNSDAVVRYIQNQEVHHRKIDFEDELRSLLRKHRIEYDPRFMFG
jgi:putative transposase